MSTITYILAFCTLYLLPGREVTSAVVPNRRIQSDDSGKNQDNPDDQWLSSQEIKGFMRNYTTAFDEFDGATLDDFNENCPEKYLEWKMSIEHSQRAACPWTYENDNDPNRRPERIQYAKCECRNCISLNCTSGGACHTFNECQPVLQKMAVFRIDGDRYVPDTETIPVGCVCVRPKVSKPE